MRGIRTAAWIACATSIAAATTVARAATAQSSATPVTCQLPEPGRHWLQEALNGWSRIRLEALRLAPAPLPWLMLFDEHCVWHLSPDPSVKLSVEPSPAFLSLDGEAVPVFAGSHTGQIPLPNGRTTGIRATAHTSVYGGGSNTFSVVSMFGVWERDPRHVRQPRLGEFFQGLVIHELTHSTQLAGVIKRVAALRTGHTMPAIVDDDVIQRWFGLVIPFRTAIEEERNVFYRAALSTDSEKRRDWAAKGLSMARKRRDRYYVGRNAAFRDLEDVFFAMEGSAQWAAYRWARLQSPTEVTDAAVMRFVRDDRKYWSQDEGLALYLLIDALVPGWQSRTFGDAIASPFALLEEALR
jgi:hypothetical protein